MTWKLNLLTKGLNQCLKRATAKRATASHSENLPVGIICTSCNKNKVEHCLMCIHKPFTVGKVFNNERSL